jgi:tellurite resistance protein
MTDHALSPQDALVAVMVAVSVSDETIRTAELVKIEQIVNNLPVFGAYDADRTRAVAQTVFELFEEEDGLDALFGLVHEALPERLWETAYAIACDVAAADGSIQQPNFGSWRNCATRSTSTGSMPPRSNAGRGHGT